jgi:hypothetical protein
MNHQVLGELVGEVLGEVLGEMDGDDMSGMATVGRRRRGGAMMRLPPKPGWRGHQLAPGVQAPVEGLEPMTLTPDAGNGVFSATITTINFTARPQRPFRPERMLVQVIRVGTTAAAAFLQASPGIFIGTSLQQLQLGRLNLEFFTTNAFGVRLSMQPCEPGIDITIPCILSSALTGTDTLAATITMLGSSVR